MREVRTEDKARKEGVERGERLEEREEREDRESLVWERWGVRKGMGKA